MSKRASKTAIGAFVLGAIVLAVAVVLIFGSGRLFTKRERYVMYFAESVGGLNVGAPVMFRGVKVGSVSNISLQLRTTDLSFVIPVEVDFEVGKVKRVGPISSSEDYLQALISKGLKAQLQAQSFVTGSLAVALDLFPDKPIRLVGSGKYPEIPTTPSTVEELSKRFEDIPIEDLVEKMRSAVAGIDEFVRSETTKSSMRSLDKTLKETAKTMESVNSQIGPILANVREASGLIRDVSAKMDQALSGEEGIPMQVKQTLEQAKKALAQAEQTMATSQEAITEGRALAGDIDAGVDEISKAARSIRLLSDYLEAHPDAIVWGRKKR
ncbi:MAG: Paraquat-inducible protein B [Syntrophorhabdaceae bacterium PtaU1.Bin034]|nr:MAG: Paraquat-inducible protein B [Syntrophorhabdaceae bacterium PtaU1.Bin034]